MGIIEKQATRNAVYSYIGSVLGFVTVMWLAHALSTSENGVVRALVSYTALFAQFANLGFVAVTARFFPYFRNREKGHHGFLFYAIIVSLIGCVLTWLLYHFFLEATIIASNESKSPLFASYIYYLMPLTFFTVFFNIFDSYLRACYNSVAGPFSKEFLLRILILVILAVFQVKIIDFSQFILLYIIATCLPTLMLLFYIVRDNEWHIRPVRGFMSKELRSEMLRLGIYSILAGGAGALILNVDTVMINQLLGEADTGIYGIAINFGVIILIPARSLYRIMTSVVAEHFKNGTVAEIHKLYRQSCNTQLTIGALLFIGIWCNIDNIMHLLPPAYAAGKNIILILGTGYLIEMATGINQVIIANSPYYKYDTYIVFFMLGLVILLNYFLIPVYGIAGSAIATVAMSAVGNGLRFLLLSISYKMQPYDKDTLKLVAIAVISFLAGYFIPYLHNLYIDIAIRSAITGGLFLLLILKTEASPDLNKKIRKNLKRVSINL